MKFSIQVDESKPHLSKLMKENREVFKEVVGTFVDMMELAAKEKWHELPSNIHSSIVFHELIEGVLKGVMSTKKMNEDYFGTLGYDLHPLALLNDKRVDNITGNEEEYDWRKHFRVSGDVSVKTIENIIRQMMYLSRWVEVEEVSKALFSQQFPIMDSKSIERLPFQPALKYQREELGDLHVGRFIHDIGSLHCGKIDEEIKTCKACKVGELKNIKQYKVCLRCNAGFVVEGEEVF